MPTKADLALKTESVGELLDERDFEDSPFYKHLQMIIELRKDLYHALTCESRNADFLCQKCMNLEAEMDEANLR